MKNVSIPLSKCSLTWNIGSLVGIKDGASNISVRVHVTNPYKGNEEQKE